MNIGPRREEAQANKTKEHRSQAYWEKTLSQRPLNRDSAAATGADSYLVGSCIKIAGITRGQ